MGPGVPSPAFGFTLGLCGVILIACAIAFQLATNGRRGTSDGLGDLLLFKSSIDQLRYAIALFLFGFTLQALLTVLKALAGVVGLVLLQIQSAYLGLGGAVVLHQRNAAGADVGAGPALDAVEQVLTLELIVVLAQGKEMQLLRQQAGRAGFGAQAAADAGLRRRWRRQFITGAGEQAVGGLDEGGIQALQGKAHHWPAHDQAEQLVWLQTGKVQQFTNRRANQRFNVGWMAQRLAGQGGDALDQRLTEHNGIVDRQQGAHVLADHAKVGGQTAAGHFLAGQNLDQLLFTAGGVLGRKGNNLHGALANRRAHGLRGFGLVVLNADQHLLGLQHMHQNLEIVKSKIEIPK